MSKPSPEDFQVHLGIAGKLEELAALVRAGHLKSLGFEWGGRTEIDLKVGFREPLGYLTVDFSTDGCKEPPK